MFRQPILISITALAIALSTAAASALPVSPPRAASVAEATSFAEPVHYRSVRKFRRHHPYVYHRRHSRPSFSFSLRFGAPVVRHYPYYYPRRVYRPYSYAPRYYYRRSYHPYHYRW